MTDAVQQSHGHIGSYQSKCFMTSLKLMVEAKITEHCLLLYMLCMYVNRDMREEVECGIRTGDLSALETVPLCHLLG